MIIVSKKQQCIVFKVNEGDNNYHDNIYCNTVAVMIL